MSSKKFLEWKRQVDKVKTEIGTRRNKFYAVIVDRDGEKCCFCGATERLEIDHIKPVINGGTNHLSNLRLLCKKCNAGRKDTHHNIPCMACGAEAKERWGYKWLCGNCIDECEEEFNRQKRAWKQSIARDLIEKKSSKR